MREEGREIRSWDMTEQEESRTEERVGGRREGNKLMEVTLITIYVLVVDGEEGSQGPSPHRSGPPFLSGDGL